MKLSNKILLGFFGFIFLYLTAAFAELRLTGTYKLLDDGNSITETVDLPDITHVILDNLAGNVTVTPSDTPRLEVRSVAGGLLKIMKYSLSGDTLRVSDFQPADGSMVRITVFVPGKTLKRVTLNRSTVSITGLQQDELYISQNEGHTWMSKNRIAGVHMRLSNNSDLSASDDKFDSLSVAVDRSQLNVPHVGLLAGSIQNESFLRVRGVNEIRVKKDESSKLHLFE